jgi:hypothetical protein
MREAIREVSEALQTLGKPSPWSIEIKASDDFLNPLFQRYFAKLGLPNIMDKSEYYVLARYIEPDEIDPDIVAKLDAIVRVANTAQPGQTQGMA